MAYTKEPSEAVEAVVSAVVVVRKRRIDVAKIVRCMWMVVCGDVGSGKASCMGVTDGAVIDEDVPLTWASLSAMRCYEGRFLYRWR